MAESSDLGDVPEPDTAEDAGGVVDDRGAVAEVDLELLRVAATHVEVVEVQQCVEHLGGLEDALAPSSVPDALSRRVAEVVLERALAVERHERELEVRHRHAVLEDRGAEPGAERQHELEAVAG